MKVKKDERNDERFGVFCHFGKEGDSGFGTSEADGLGKLDLEEEERDRDCCAGQEDAIEDMAVDNHNSNTKDAMVHTLVVLSSCAEDDTCTWESLC